jgi:hypothetical protein
MNNGIESIVQIQKDSAESAIGVLVRVFQDYPLLHFYYPDESIREKITFYFLSFMVYSGIRYGKVYASSSNMEGVAVWIPSSNYPMTFWKLLRSVPLSTIINFGRYGGSKMRQFGDYLDSVHKRLAPFRHWFLQTIGVDLSFQGKGFSSKLLRPMLYRMDEEGLPCYLETIDEKNVPIYEHFSFRVIDKSNIPETEFKNWAMLRKSQ